MWRNLSVFFLITILVGSVFIQSVKAIEYPTKPVELVCIYTPGGTMDLWSRLVADITQKYLGQPIIVVSKPGAMGSIGAADVISSKPDGDKLIGLTNFFHATTVQTERSLKGGDSLWNKKSFRSKMQFEHVFD